MNEVSWLMFLRNISFVCNSIGLLTALLFLIGPKLLLSISRLLDTYRPSVSLEKLLLTKARIVLGLLLLVISTLMLLLIVNLKI